MSKIFPFRMTDEFRSALEKKMKKSGVASNLTAYMTMVLSGGLKVSDVDSGLSNDLEDNIYDQSLRIQITKQLKEDLVRAAKGKPLSFYLRRLIFKKRLVNDQEIVDEFAKLPDVRRLLDIHNTLEFVVKELNSRGIKDCAKLVEMARVEMKEVVVEYRKD